MHDPPTPNKYHPCLRCPPLSQQDMAMTLRHRPHKHPLELLHQPGPGDERLCHVCNCRTSGYIYTCHEGCKIYAHKRCVEAPPLIQHHPFHPSHPLSLLHERKRSYFYCDACDGYWHSRIRFRCDECNVDLDIGCALSTLPDREEGSPPKHITIPFHNHPLTSFHVEWQTTIRCVLCQECIEGDGFTCCRFRAHKRCIQDLHYEDGAEIPPIYHGHNLAAFLVEEGSFIRCRDCKSGISGQCIGCLECHHFYHRDCCTQVPEILQYPPHPHHTLVQFIDAEIFRTICQSCSGSISGELCYRCSACGFVLHASCGLQTLNYCEEGASAEIGLPWHEHPLLLCHMPNDADRFCSGCGDNVKGLAYRCSDSWYCSGLLLHKPCAELMKKINHPNHPEHSLILITDRQGGTPPPCCNACCEEIVGFNYSCKFCAFYLDAKCASQVPTKKHCLHEHNLLYFDGIPSLECNRCGMSTNSSFLRCVPCDFNLHEKCMELPPIARHKSHHFHPLTLRDSYVEDDTGEYYCDICETSRDIRLGVYVCEECKTSVLFHAHIHCVLPELRGLFTEWTDASAIQRLVEEAAIFEEEVRALKKKLDEAELKLRNKREETTLFKTKQKRIM